MDHLEDLLKAASIEDTLLHRGRWYVTKDAALAGMTAARLSAIEECAKTIPGGNICDPQEIADRIRALKT